MLRAVSEEPIVIEIEKLSEVEYVLVGLPDTGLVGTIALGHAIRSKKMREIGYFAPRALPPMLVVHNGEPKSPVRIYANDNFAALISEAPLPLETYQELATHLAKWAVEKKAQLLISLTGIGVQNRVEVIEPQVFSVGSTAEVRESLRSKGILPLEEGFVVGPQAILLEECMEKTIPMAVLLAQSHTQFPDPVAAAAIVQNLNQVFGFKIDVKELVQEAEEFRIRLRELMNRTQQSLGTVKSQEGELPALYT